MGNDPMRNSPAGADRTSDHPTRGGAVASDRVREWALLGEWLSAPPLLHKVDLDVVRERLVFVGRARASLAALEAELVSEVARREGAAAAEEMLRRDQKRSRSGARKAVKTAAQLEWAPNVAEKLADGAITPEAAGLILDAAAEGPVDQRQMLAAAEEEPDDRFRRTLKEHVNERTSEQELNERRARQRSRRRASITEQPDGMFHLFAQFDPLVGNQVRAALVAKADALFRSEDLKQRSTPPQRFADALAGLVCSSAGTEARGGAGADGDADTGRGGTEARGGTGADGHADTGRGNSGACSGAGCGGGVPQGFELIVLADYDLVHERIANARLTDGTRLTETETLAVACDAKILPGIFNKHTGTIVLGRSQRKIPKRLRKRLVARDRGCIGCGAHEQICEVHHIVPWTHGGATTYENTCLLCWRCHHVRVHEHGEEITRHPDGTLTLAPPDTPPPGPAGPPGGDQIDGHEPRSRGPGHRRAHRAPTSNHYAATSGHPAPAGDHRRGPPATPATSPAGPTTLPFAAAGNATAPLTEHDTAPRTARQTAPAPAGTTTVSPSPERHARVGTPGNREQGCREIAPVHELS